MKTYTVYFRSDAETASHDLKAKTPQHALAKAQELYRDDPSKLWFEPYDGGMPVNEIEVCDDEDNSLTTWYDDDLRLRLAAQDLLEATERVVTRLAQGDLAEAVRNLSAVIAEAKGGAA